MSEKLYHAQVLALAKSGAGADDLTRTREAADGAGGWESGKLLNPMCGDEVEVWARVAGGVVLEMRHRTRGCVLCRAASAALAGRVGGMTTKNARRMTADFSRMLNEGGELVSGLEMFAPVAARPSRRRCALLPFQALEEILERAED